jgi:hypothetical protein
VAYVAYLGRIEKGVKISVKMSADAKAADKEYMDEYDDYNIDQEKYVHSAHSGKGRSKKEASLNHHEDPAGHTRKNTQKLMNNASNNKKA